VWSVSAEGGSPRQILDSDYFYPTVAPGGKRFAALDAHAPRAVWSIFDLATGHLIARLPSVPSRTVQWTPDGSALISMGGQNGVDNLISYPVDDSEAHVLTHFTTEGIYRFDVAPDGTLAILRGRTILDVVVVTNEAVQHP
jgi:Tol biopolymer transport system component